MEESTYWLRGKGKINVSVYF